jgi:hypothetical protein
MGQRPAVAGSLSGRGLVLLPAGALLVHQLRYWLTYGSQTSNELGAQGHVYLGSLVPWIVMLLAGALGWFLTRLARASRFGSDGVKARPFLRLWATTGSGLVGIYALQEFFEGLFAEGHPTGLAGIFGHGGWWAVPTAAAVAGVIVALLRVGRALERLVGRTRRALHQRIADVVRRSPATLFLVAGPPLAYAAAGRAPPARLQPR